MDTIYVLFGLGLGGFLAWKLYQQQSAGDGANDQIICPHCATQGHVTVSTVQRKKGISGGKATGGLATGGASLFLTGLSRKQWAKHKRCGNCRMEWDVE